MRKNQKLAPKNSIKSFCFQNWQATTYSTKRMQNSATCRRILFKKKQPMCLSNKKDVLRRLTKMSNAFCRFKTGLSKATQQVWHKLKSPARRRVPSAKTRASRRPQLGKGTQDLPMRSVHHALLLLIKRRFYVQFISETCNVPAKAFHLAPGLQTPLGNVTIA